MFRVKYLATHGFTHTGNMLLVAIWYNKQEQNNAKQVSIIGSKKWNDYIWSRLLLVIVCLHSCPILHCLISSFTPEGSVRLAVKSTRVGTRVNKKTARVTTRVATRHSSPTPHFDQGCDSTRVKSNYIQQIILYIVVSEPSQRASFSIPVKSGSFLTFHLSTWELEIIPRLFGNPPEPSTVLPDSGTCPSWSPTGFPGYTRTSLGPHTQKGRVSQC